MVYLCSVCMHIVGEPIPYGSVNKNTGMCPQQILRTVVDHENINCNPLENYHKHDTTTTL